MQRRKGVKEKAQRTQFEFLASFAPLREILFLRLVCSPRAFQEGGGGQQGSADGRLGNRRTVAGAGGNPRRGFVDVCLVGAESVAESALGADGDVAVFLVDAQVL